MRAFWEWLKQRMRILSQPRLRAEIGWVLTSKGTEFLLLFALLKVITLGLGPEGFGEYNFVDVGIILASSVMLVPIRESFLRDYYGLAERGELGAGARLLIRWYLVATVFGVLTALALAFRADAWLGLQPLTVALGGLVFFFECWRLLGHEILNIRRLRRRWAMSGVGFLATQLVAVSCAILIFTAQPWAALAAYAAASGLFAFLVTAPILRELASLPRSSPTRLGRMAWTFGAPLAAVLIFQWLQSFSDRFLLGLLLSVETAGIYIAAYQVCGAPYVLLRKLVHNFVTPIAYRRGSDESNPRSLWAADRVVLAGAAVQLGLGSALLPIYALFGTSLVVFLTSERFAVSMDLVLTLAAARLVQSLAESLQPVFAVHHRLGSMLWFRLSSAIATVAICSFMIQRYGIMGAAWGSLLGFSLYLAAIALFPHGCVWLILDARRRSRVTVEPPSR